MSVYNCTNATPTCHAYSIAIVHIKESLATVWIWAKLKVGLTFSILHYHSQAEDNTETPGHIMILCLPWQNLVRRKILPS